MRFTPSKNTLSVNRLTKLPPDCPTPGAHSARWSKLGSVAILMPRSLGCAEEAGLQQVELAAPIHLAFDELQLGDLAFGLAVGP